jgi:diguanylate cyclase (GGDEF)-like protein/PAS domain S-box-containing protein
MKQTNSYTISLFSVGILSLPLVPYAFTLDVNWLVFSVITAVTMFYDLVPVKLPNGIDYSISMIGSIYLLYEYGFSTACVPILFYVVTHYYIKNGFRVPWFRFFVTLGMYTSSIAAAWVIGRVIETNNIYIDVFIISLTCDGINLLLRNGIMKTVYGIPMFRKPSIKTLINVQVPGIVCALVVIQLVLADTFAKWIWSLGVISFFVVLLSYMTSAYHKQLLSVEENSLRLKSLYENNPDIVMTVDSKGTLIAANPMLEQTLGYSKDHIIGQSMFNLIEPEGRADFAESFPQQLNSAAASKSIRVLHADKSIKDFTITCVPTVVNQQVVGAYMIGKDITLEKEADRMIQTMAYYDSITGLPNRVLMMDQLHHEIRSAEMADYRIGVLFIDFDHFKAVNDTFGHSMGDMLLIKVSQRLRELAPAGSLVARLGGDEFLIMLRDGDDERCSALARELLKGFENSILLGEQPIYITPSIGISIYPQHGISAEQLISQADAAMYRVKNAGGSHYKVFTPDMQKEHEDNKLISMLLRNCIENQEIWLQYQPQLDIKTGVVTGAEALARWTNPILGHVSPARFIPIAEQNNLILSIGNWILKTACMQNKQWQDAGYPPIKIAVNISSIQLLHDDFVDMVKGILAEAKLEPRWLELELTESVLIQNTARNLQILQDLRQLGVQIAVDDFGVGYSSLSYLNRFSLDILKIDRSFVQNIGKNASEEAIIRTIIRLAKDLELNVVAEGIETKEQYEFVKSEECDSIQGYYYSKPLHGDDFVKRIWDSSDTNDGS